MKKQIKEYINEVEEKLNQKEINKDFKEDILNHISFFQHERLIHLLVTLFVGICAIIIFISMIALEKIALIPIFILLILLFIPYIFHYYFLENSIQKLYILYKEYNRK